jgi:hypothetical protein
MLSCGGVARSYAGGAVGVRKIIPSLDVDAANPGRRPRQPMGFIPPASDVQREKDKRILRYAAQVAAGRRIRFLWRTDLRAG